MASKAGAGLLKFAGAFGVAVTATEAFNKVINSSQTLSDEYNRTMDGLKGVVDQFFYSIGTAENQRELLALKCHSVNQNITELSGGNQQKVLISKWLCCCPEVIIFDEPTRGIDVGAKAEIYKVMRQLADDGKVILMVSSELPEIITVCDRIAVFCEGRLTQILTNRDDMSEEEIMAWALPQE